MTQTAEQTGRTFGRAARQALYICIAGAFLGLLVNALRPAGLALIPPDKPPAPQSKSGAEQAGLQTIEPAAALAELKQGSAVFIDARSAYDYRAGHIPTARNLQEKNLDTWMPDFFQQVPPETRLIFYCSGPRCRLADRLAGRLHEFGYTDTHVLTAGWQAWQTGGYPTEADPALTAGQSLEPPADCNTGECSDARMSSEEPAQSQ